MSSVNDAFSVSLSPSSCVINAKWNGEDPDYSNAYSDLSVYRGDVAVPFEIIDVITTHIGNCDIADLPYHVKRIKILEIEDGALSGKLSFQIKCGDDFTTWVNLPFTVVRETSMLDWILDWEGREKTEIAGEHIITPKIFVGKSEDGGKLTGTYIGPSFDYSGRVGVFGYSAGKEIFHLDDTGGMIGGWYIEDGGIQTSDGVLKICSEGTIISAPDGEMAWQLLKDGSATFAGGNVHFYANGDADFKGTITSTSGKIGGWVIGEHSLYNQAILIDSEAKFIGIRRVNNLYFIKEPTSEKFYENIKQDGGIAIFSQNNISYGIECWVPTIKGNDYNNPVDGIRVFKLGDSNEIAGWNFDGEALWRGVRNNTARQNTSVEGSITIGSAGMRGMNWYIDHDGEISFVDGLLHFDKNGGTIAGWTLNQNMFATTKAALVSASGYTGLYLSNSALPESYINYGSHIRDKGGIYLTTSAIGAILRGSDSQGKLLFQLTGSVSFIGGWWFSESCLFTGISPTPTGEFATQGNITLSPDGLRGHKFRLEASGAGAIAGGKISWDDDGNMTFDSSVTLSWAQITGTEAITNKLTKIDANGIYTGTITANNITAGTISTADIICDGKWALMRDGTGYLAARNISWDADGTLTVKGHIEADSGSIGSGEHKFDITSSGIAYGDISNWNKSDLSQKMLLNPASLRLQYSDPSNSSQACKIYLGKESWPSRASSFPYGTIAWIYKKDLANLEMEGSRCSEPAIRIETETIYGSGVAISSNGAIIANGVISEKGYLLTASTSMVSMMHFSPFNGSTFIIKNTTGQERSVQLPNEGTVRFVLDLAVNEPFIYRIKAFCLPENNVVSIGLDNNTAIKCYVNGKEQAASTKYQLVANHLYEFILIYDGNHHTIWHLKDIT